MMSVLLAFLLREEGTAGLAAPAASFLGNVSAPGSRTCSYQPKIISEMLGLLGRPQFAWPVLGNSCQPAVGRHMYGRRPRET